MATFLCVNAKRGPPGQNGWSLFGSSTVAASAWSNCGLCRMETVHVEEFLLSSCVLWIVAGVSRAMLHTVIPYILFQVRNTRTQPHCFTATTNGKSTYLSTTRESQHSLCAACGAFLYPCTACPCACAGSVFIASNSDVYSTCAPCAKMCGQFDVLLLPLSPLSQITDDSFVSGSATAPVNASANLLSNFPDVGSIGEFLQRVNPTSMGMCSCNGAHEDMWGACSEHWYVPEPCS